MEPDDPKSPFLGALVLAQGGDQDAINDLFTMFYPRVRQIVHKSLATDLRRGRSWLTMRFSTGDVVQEVFWSVLRNLKDFGGNTEQAFIGYLAMVVRNRIIDAIRHHEAEMRDGRRGAEGLEAELHEQPGASPLDQAVSAESAERYRAALAEFPDREQLLLRARFEETATFEELAEQLGYSSEAAARRAFYGATARLSLILKPAEPDQDDVS